MTEDPREWAWYVGTDTPDRPWLIHPGDAWVANPHYRGPAVRHPDDDEEPE